MPIRACSPTIEVRTNPDDANLDRLAHFLQDGTSPFYRMYLSAWIAFCLMAIIMALRDRRALLHEARKYMRFLLMPWKLALFVPAFLFVTFAGRYSFDDTWDVGTGGGMALLTFLTAPWAVGAAYQTYRGHRPRCHAVIAIAAGLFSASWFYDGYLMWRDGVYGPLWLPNLFVSPYIYVAAGLLWNLEAGGNAWGRLGFTRPDWPTPPENPRFGPILAATLPLTIFAAVILTQSVHWRH